MLNKQKGNMYGFVTHTWNPIKGLCMHDCSYCYMKKMYKRYKWDKTIRLDEKCMNDNLGKDKFIFVGSSTDMFAENVEKDDIRKVLNKCCGFDNQYLFQSKNPKRFGEFVFPDNTILATTLETNYFINQIANKTCPDILDRINGITELYNIDKMITIEPIMDFDLKRFVEILKKINPTQINIGADSGHNNLKEPSKEKTLELISAMEPFTKVNIKDNLKRIIQK